MTVEELKEEANKLGYNIVKKPERYIPCKCGTNSRHWIWKDGFQGLRCSKCGFEVISHDNRRVNQNKMRELWNDVLREEMKNVRESD